MKRWIWVVALALWVIVALTSISLFKMSVDKVKGQTVGTTFKERWP